VLFWKETDAERVSEIISVPFLKTLFVPASFVEFTIPVLMLRLSVAALIVFDFFDFYGSSLIGELEALAAE